MKLIVNQAVQPTRDAKIIRVMSYNIRMAPCIEDDQTENAWRYRLPKVAMIFNEYLPDIVGLQEVSSPQMASLKECSFKVPYAFLGKYPTREPRESGLGILYNPQKISPLCELHTT